METRRRYVLVAVAMLALTACGGKKDKDAPKGGLDQRCEQLAKTCGDTDKHAEKIGADCKQAAPKQTEKNCADKVSAAYDCMAKELCGKGDKIWALDDLRVLADRNKKCVAERKAVDDCVGK